MIKKSPKTRCFRGNLLFCDIRLKYISLKAFVYPEKPINSGFVCTSIAYVLYAVDYSHIPRTTHRPNAFVYNIIPSALICPVQSNIHLDILLVHLYAYE